MISCAFVFIRVRNDNIRQTYLTIYSIQINFIKARKRKQIAKIIFNNLWGFLGSWGRGELSLKCLLNSIVSNSHAADGTSKKMLFKPRIASDGVQLIRL